MADEHRIVLGEATLLDAIVDQITEAIKRPPAHRVFHIVAFVGLRPKRLHKSHLVMIRVLEPEIDISAQPHLKLFYRIGLSVAYGFNVLDQLGKGLLAKRVEQFVLIVEIKIYSGWRVLDSLRYLPH